MPDTPPPREAASVLSQSFHVDVPCSLSVDVPGARTQLHPGSDAEQVDVDLSVTGCSPDEAEEILKRVGVATRQRKNTIQVYSDNGRSDAEWWRWVRTFDALLNIDLQVPPRIEADIRVPGGSVDIADLQGHFDVKVIGGSCQVTDAGGTLDVRAESSDVSIRGFSGDQIVARVAVGALRVEDVEADTITVRSVAAPMTLSSISGATTVTANGGQVELQDLSGPCTTRVDGGPLHYNGRPDEKTDLHVVGSSLEARLPADHEADLLMTGPTLALDDRFSYEGERTETEIEGTLNGGGPLLSLSAAGGRVACQCA